MTIQNPQAVPIAEIAHRLQSAYPTATVKKAWLTGEYISIPMKNYRLFVRKGKAKLTTDFTPPVLWSIIALVIVAGLFSFLLTVISGRSFISFGGAIPVLIVVFGTKAIFKSKNKELLERFDRDVQLAMTGGTSAIF